DSRLSSWLGTVPRRQEPNNASAATGSRSKTSATGRIALAARTTSSREYVIDRIKHHKRFVLGALLIFALSAIVGGYRFFAARRGSDKEIQSIAVLPFVNETGDANLDYISDGITESLIDSLSRLPNLRVTARTSTFQYKNTSVDPGQVSRS